MTDQTQPQADEKPFTITIDETEYVVSDLSKAAQDLIAVHQAWSQDVGIAQVEAQKANTRLQQVQAAMQQVSSKVVETVRADEAAKAEAARITAEVEASTKSAPD